MLTCRDMSERASEFLDGELPFTTRLGFRMHLLMCRHCRRYVEQLSRVVGALRGLAAPAPQAPPTTLMDELKNRRQGS